MKYTKIEDVGNRTIVRAEKEKYGIVDWVVCRGYNENRPDGQKWDAGIYFTSLKDAVDCAYGNEPMYLVITHENMEYGSNIYSVVKTKEDAYDKVLEFVKYEGLEQAMDWKTLKESNYVTVGDDGFVRIKEYNLGDDITMDEDN